MFFSILPFAWLETKVILTFYHGLTSFHSVLLLLPQSLGPAPLNPNFAAVFSLVLRSHLKTINHTNA